AAAGGHHTRGGRDLRDRLHRSEGLRRFALGSPWTNAACDKHTAWRLLSSSGRERWVRAGGVGKPPRPRPRRSGGTAPSAAAYERRDPAGNGLAAPWLRLRQCGGTASERADGPGVDRQVRSEQSTIQGVCRRCGLSETRILETTLHKKRKRSVLGGGDRRLP